ncbi:hypothetical protein [Georgenia alba]|uniref:Uncharacterized protein n=1 Tax=Georgenia alba TaxID=2233858 RepID=A0ABW2QBH9_9MICO
MSHDSRPGVRHVLPLLAVLIGLAACSAEPEPDPVEVSVEVRDWTGWSREQPEPEHTTVELSDGATFQVETVSGTVTFTATDVSVEDIELETDQDLVVPNPGGGIDLDGGESRFTLTPDPPLELVTPTMDAGTRVILTVRR